jgi:hypothetical protein
MCPCIRRLLSGRRLSYVLLSRFIVATRGLSPTNRHLGVQFGHAFAAGANAEKREQRVYQTGGPAH